MDVSKGYQKILRKGHLEIARAKKRIDDRQREARVLQNSGLEERPSDLEEKQAIKARPQETQTDGERSKDQMPATLATTQERTDRGNLVMTATSLSLIPIAV